jgi:hypothetical protein
MAIIALSTVAATLELFPIKLHKTEATSLKLLFTCYIYAPHYSRHKLAVGAE